ncbi:CLUMA_CG014879, isoform A [Clunio marinus]|uniref:BET1 homolog n=1 Tax=Clunio marinus TaxID=568069 RepID=A0A1J1IT26_9DIPT|nr:CLUMA_CG014879, isoform A [Clunio marinus]
MMRRPQNYGYEPVPQNQSDDLEIENEMLADDLKNKISNLKSLTIDIGNEVRYQDKILNDLDDDMNRTGGFMQNTIGRVVRLSKHRKGYTCYMLLFALLVFLILYVVLKFK